jgi:FkbM family methyltransferase
VILSADGDAPIHAERTLLPDGTSVWTHAPAEALHIFDEVVQRECYLPAGSGIALPTSAGAGADGALIIDVGANIGLFSLWASKQAPSAQLLAIEPAVRTFALLEANLGAWGCSSRVAAVQAALGDTPMERAPLLWYARMPGNSTLHPDEKAADAVAFRPGRREAMFRCPGNAVDLVRVETLSALLRSRGCVGNVALLKIDVEGSESSVLHGVTQDDWPRIEQVVVETHTQEKRQGVLDTLRRHYEIVGEVADVELESCGLDRAIVYARRPRVANPTR